jgi:hypothetical protein
MGKDRSPGSCTVRQLGGSFMVKGVAHDGYRARNRHRRLARDPRVVSWLAIGQRVMRRRAKRREAEGHDRQAQSAEQERQNDSIGSQSVAAFPDSTPVPRADDSKGKSIWGRPADHSEVRPPPPPPPPPENASLARAADPIGVVVIRISSPGRGTGQPVTLTITRREVPVTPEPWETPDDLAMKAKDRLDEEIEGTASAAVGQNIANRILPVQEPTGAVPVVQLKSDLHSILLGQSVPRLAQYVPLPGIDRSLDTAELAILVGGIVLGAVTATPALSSVCVKSLAHKAIANAAEEVIKEAIESALSDYRASPPKPTVHTGPARSVAVELGAEPALQPKPDESPGDLRMSPS